MTQIDVVSEKIGHLLGKVDALKCDTKEIKDHLKALNGSVQENTTFRKSCETLEKRVHWKVVAITGALGVLFTGINVLISYVR